MVLAELQPDVFGVGSRPPLVIFGVPPPEGLLVLSNNPPTSGSGPDNRWMNALEAILTHLQSATNVASQATRSLLLETLKRFRLTAACLVAKGAMGDPKAPILVKE